MKKRAVLTLMEGSFERGFPVILQLGSVGSVGAIATAEIQVSGMLPKAPQLWEVFQHWQSAYHQMVEPQSRMKAKKAQVTNISSRQLSYQLADCLNEWLNSGTKEWQKIRDSLQRHLNSTDEIEVFIQTSDRRLRQLPWQIWDFFEYYPHAEVVLATPDYRRAKTLPRSNGRVRILAILGDSTKIDVEQDRAYLDRLSDRAEIEFLIQPKPEQLGDRLWSQKWDILFFAGHSSSQEEGRIWLNKTDCITIAQLRYGLQKAVKNGLRLAIFNSCDGLGLAEKLADLQIAQTIVMREPVTNAVAQAFLKYFLTAFTSGQSLTTAVREARNRLLILEKDFPYASWLPVIFAHPAELPPTWQELCGRKGDRSLPLKKRLFAALIGSVAVTALTMGIRQLGILQTWELRAFDHLMQLRPPEPPDPRLLIVTITGKDVQSQDPQQRRSSSLSERSLWQLLEKLQPYHPRVIGLDIYRDFPVNFKYKNLKTYLETNKSFVGVCKVGEAQDDLGIRPAPELRAERLSFSNFPVDRDRVIRRQLLGMAIAPESFCQTDTSFSFRVAQLYLAHEGISSQRNPQGDLQIDKVVFKKLQSDAGSYQNLDALGYQVLLNYRSYPKVAEQITLGEILNADGDKLRELVKDRVVLIGTVAKDFKDYHSTPYSEEELPGVTIQAHMISQILSAVKDERSLIWWLPGWGEVIWLWGWALLGGSIGSLALTPLRLGLFSTAATLVLYGSCFIFLWSGGWIPLIPPLLSGIMTGTTVVFYLRFNQSQRKYLNTKNDKNQLLSSTSIS